jgi:hypothetical protein
MSEPDVDVHERNRLAVLNAEDKGLRERMARTA